MNKHLKNYLYHLLEERKELIESGNQLGLYSEDEMELIEDALAELDSF